MTFHLNSTVINGGAAFSHHTPVRTDDKLHEIASCVLQIMRKDMRREASEGNYRIWVSASIQDSDQDYRVRWRAEAETFVQGDGVGYRVKWGYTYQHWRAETTDPDVKWPSRGLGKVPA
jgi:hypothetical protein